MAAALATLHCNKQLKNILKQQLVTCATLLQQTRMKIQLERPLQFRAEVKVVLEEVTVVAWVVARAMDTDGEAGDTTTTKRNCLPGAIQQKNGDSSPMSQKNL